MIEQEFKLVELVILVYLEMSRQRLRESAVKWKVDI